MGKEEGVILIIPAEGNRACEEGLESQPAPHTLLQHGLSEGLSVGQRSPILQSAKKQEVLEGVILQGLT